MWNAGEVNRDPGDHIETLSDGWTFLYEGNDGREQWGIIEELSFQYLVRQQAWLGQYRPQDCRGLIDHLEGEIFVPSYISFEDLPIKRDESCVAISDPERVILDAKGLFITAENFNVDAGTYLSATVSDEGPVAKWPLAPA
ncbi:hypothetical protein AB0M46_26550 [Dactylosporangium sp. NPDC051485]|uniref:hypothetical protein n=1 Tax=Dactylosporangium sp. NPDC051485 TaxID=3154846 RepID=UPI00343F8CDE